MTLSGRLLECITSESVAEILNDSALGGSSIPIMSKWLADASVKIQPPKQLSVLRLTTHVLIIEIGQH